MATPLGDSGLFSIPEFNNRGVIKLAPDALVYISGNVTEAVIAPVNSTATNVNFNDGITTVSVQNNVDPPGSSNASIEVATPIYEPGSKYWVKFDDPYTNKTVRMPFFIPMMEVKIFFKGRYMTRAGRGQYSPRYYPAFWGFITNVEENYSGGMWKINLQCADMLHWWSYSQVNVHPIPASSIAAGGGLTLTAYATIFKDANPFQIMYTLTQGMGMHEFVVPTWVAQSTPLSQIYPPKAFRSAVNGIMDYWRVRFGKLGNLLKMYGTAGQQVQIINGKKVRTISIQEDIAAVEQNTSQKKSASKNTVRKQIGMDNTYLQNFTVFFDFSKMGEFTDAEYMSKLEVATEVKNRIDYEFFQDVNGNWIFKPPFYNLNTKTAFPYIIKPQEIISNSFSLDTEGIVTVLEVQLPFHTSLREQGPPRKGFHMDLELAARYGIRYKKQNIEYMVKDNTKVGNHVAAAYMSYYNAKCTTGSVTMPGRPEIRLGYPVYVEHKDAFYYVKSINHSFDYAGSFNTTLSLEAERKKVYNFEGDNWVGPLKDKIYLYQGPAGENERLNGISDVAEKARQLQTSTGQISSIEQGRYKIVDRQRPEQIALTDQSIPFTDEEGYRVIGAFTYGRGLFVSGASAMDKAATFTNNSDKINEERQADIVTGAELEADEMSKIFDQMVVDGKTDDPIETIVPRYMTGFNISDPKVTDAMDLQMAAQHVNETIVTAVPTGVTNETTGTVASTGSKPK